MGRRLKVLGVWKTDGPETANSHSVSSSCVQAPFSPVSRYKVVVLGEPRCWEPESCLDHTPSRALEVQEGHKARRKRSLGVAL